MDFCSKYQYLWRREYTQIPSCNRSQWHTFDRVWQVTTDLENPNQIFYLQNISEHEALFILLKSEFSMNVVQFFHINFF